MPIQIQLRRDTAANWTSVNPILAQGEEGLETDTRLKKMGDGVTAWNSLSYNSGVALPTDTSIVLSDVTTNNASTTKHGFVPKLPNDASLFYNGVGSFTAPGGSNGVPNTRTVNGHALSADVTVTKSDVGLGNVDNTSDANKPVSTAQSVADAAILTSAQTYAAGLVVGLWDDRGSFNASVNTYPSSGGSGSAGAIMKGDIWTISASGTIGGHAVTAGDTIRALIDTPGTVDANWAIGENNTGYVPENAANKNASGGYAGLTLLKLNLINALGTITSFFTTAATVARTWTMPDKDGTVAMTSDITGTNSGINTGDQDLSGLQVTSAKDASGGYAGLTLLKINFKNTLNSFTSFFTNANTASRTYTFQDRNGTIADDTDLATKQATLVSGTNIKTVNSTSLLGSGNIVISGASAPLSLAGGTVSASTPVIDITQTWNNGAVAFDGIVINITKTAADSASNFIRLRRDTFDIIKLGQNGDLSIGPGSLTANTINAGSAIYTSYVSLSSSAGALYFGAGAGDVALQRNAANILEVNSGTLNAYRDLKLRNLMPQVFTVATLPSASTQGAGARSHVSDATAPTFGATVVGGGAISTPVYSDGTNWKVG